MHVTEIALKKKHNPKMYSNPLWKCIPILFKIFWGNFKLDCSILLMHTQFFISSGLKTECHDIAEILLKVGIKYQ